MFRIKFPIFLRGNDRKKNINFNDINNLLGHKEFQENLFLRKNKKKKEEDDD